MPQTITNGIPFYNINNGIAGCQNNALTPNQSLVVGGVTVVPGTTVPINVNGTGLPAGSVGSPYPCRVNPYFTSALWFTNAGQSWYNGLQVSVTKRLGHGLSIQGAYTYSKSEDDTQGMRFNDDCGGNAAAPFSDYPFNPKEDWSDSCYDITHVMHFNLLYHLPGIKSNGFVSKLTNGWWMSSVVAVQGGPPFSPIVNTDRAFDGLISQSNIMRASLNTTTITTANGTFIPYDPKTVITGNPNQWFNPLMFGGISVGNGWKCPAQFASATWLG